MGILCFLMQNTGGRGEIRAEKARDKTLEASRLEDHSLRSLLPSSGTGQTCSRLSPAPASRRMPGRPEPEGERQIHTQQPSVANSKINVYQSTLHLRLHNFFTLFVFVTICASMPHDYIKAKGSDVL